MITESLSEEHSTSDGKMNVTMKELLKRIETLENLIYQSKEVLNLEEAAKFIGVTRSQLYKLTHNHLVPYYKPSGKLVYFEKVELLKWLRQNPVLSQAQIESEANLHLQRLALK